MNDRLWRDVKCEQIKNILRLVDPFTGTHKSGPKQYQYDCLARERIQERLFRIFGNPL